ncbi:MAG: hypothetical protein Q9168_005438 [Polycauliona sp. 1 TL-2023]
MYAHALVFTFPYTMWKWYALGSLFADHWIDPISLYTSWIILVFVQLPYFIYNVWWVFRVYRPRKRLIEEENQERDRQRKRLIEKGGEVCDRIFNETFKEYEDYNERKWQRMDALMERHENYYERKWQRMDALMERYEKLSQGCCTHRSCPEEKERPEVKQTPHGKDQPIVQASPPLFADAAAGETLGLKNALSWQKKKMVELSETMREHQRVLDEFEEKLELLEEREKEGMRG